VGWCRGRENGKQEVLAPNVLELLDSPVISCPDYEDGCGLLFGQWHAR
jgi:hypothetical protein